MTGVVRLCRAFGRNGTAGLILTVLLLLVTVTAWFGLTPYDPVAQHAGGPLEAPSTANWFGTDQFGRDIASRVFSGIGTSLRVALLAVALSTVIGSALGIAAGYVGRWLDAVIGRFADVLFAFPAILLALAIVAGLGHGWINTAIAIAVVYTPIFLRVSRGPTLAVRNSEYVQAGQVLGYSTGRILLRHVLPNVAPPVVVQVMLALSWAIITESGLSFLGLGTQPPQPSLGGMVNEARNLLEEGWWMLAAPAGLIIVAVVALNLLGDGLRSALDPRSVEERSTT